MSLFSYHWYYILDSRILRFKQMYIYSTQPGLYRQGTDNSKEKDGRNFWRAL
jgi:hypothetical protein